MIDANNGVSVAEAGDGGWELRTQVPPGYFELVSHESDDDMFQAMDDYLEPVDADLSPDEAATVRAQFASARRLCVAAGMRLGGSVVTVWDEQVTMWTYGVWVVPVESTIGLNPVGLIERVLGGALAGGPSPLAAQLTHGTLEDFELLGGRVGTSLYAAVDTTKLPPAPEVDMAALPDEVGVVLAAVPMPSMPDVAALVMGACPSVAERGAMALFASTMAHSVHLMPIGTDVRPSLVDITPDQAFGWEG